ncbi:MAG: GerAB/ArcD/ProY family transporter [Bacillota bacterium]|jgi:spore germination protein (amino acid permease)
MAYILGIKAILITPSFLIQKVGSGAWVTVMISAVLGFLGLWGWMLWTRATENMAFVPAVRRTLGRLLGDLIVTVLLTSFIFATAMNARLFAGGAVVGLLPQFPIEVLLVLTLGASAYTAWLGLEHVAKAAIFFFWPTIISIVGLIIASSKALDARNVLPVFGLGVSKVIVEGFRAVGLWGLVPVFAFLKSYVSDERALGKGACKGLLFASLGLTLTVLTILMFFPYPASTRLAHPVGTLARAVYAGRFLQRLEAAFTFTWFFASAVQISFSYMYVLIVLSQLANAHTYRPFMPGLISLFFGLAVLPTDIFKASVLVNRLFFDSLGIVCVLLGWVLFAIAKVRGIEGEVSNEESVGSSQGRA